MSVPTEDISQLRAEMNGILVELNAHLSGEVMRLKDRVTALESALRAQHKHGEAQDVIIKKLVLTT